MGEGASLFSNTYVLSIVLLAVILLFLVVLLIWLNKKMKRFEQINEKAKELNEGEKESSKEIKEDENSVEYKPNVKPLPEMKGNKSFDENKLTLSQKGVLNKARAIIQESRRVGFSDLEIRNMFRERQWPDEDIEYILKNTR